MIRTPVCDLLQIEHPIALGGMGSIQAPALVSAVSSAGGLGAMGCHYLTAGQIRAGAAAIRERTNKPFALNFLVFDANEDAFSAALALHPPVVALAWPRRDQDLKPYIARAHAAGSKVTFMVAAVADAVRAAEAGADVIIAQGTEGGGHVGWQTTMTLVPMVVDAVAPIPVLAAGGIADGRGLVAALSLGADGVLLGTRFLASAEFPTACELQAGDPRQRRPRHAALGDSRSCGRLGLARRDVALATQPVHRAVGRAGMGPAPGAGGSARGVAGGPPQRRYRRSRALDGAGRGSHPRHPAGRRDRRPHRPASRARSARAASAIPAELNVL